jgi:hypothetical protein
MMASLHEVEFPFGRGSKPGIPQRIPGECHGCVCPPFDRLDCRRFGDDEPPEATCGRIVRPRDRGPKVKGARSGLCRHPRRFIIFSISFSNFGGHAVSMG